MAKSNTGGIKRGQAISFRVPSDTPDYLLKHLQNLKETEKRNFSSKVAGFVMDGVGNSFERKRESITVPLPQKLTKSQRDWMKHEHSEALMGTILYHLLSDPVRATSLLGSLNSSSYDIDEALYLQEEEPEQSAEAQEKTSETSSLKTPVDQDDDLDTFDWDSVSQTEGDSEDEESEEDLDDMLGDFLAEMNK